ncbi:MAG: glycosyltransferase family 39 protein [Chloroflexota bacterium]|nr:glycosyltransferase family 39 protein [Chloroflexota bacterium]
MVLSIATVTFLAYLITLTRTPTGDSLGFALAVERAGWTELLLPHRLLIQPFGWAFAQGWLALGWQGGALVPLQVFSALGGAVAAALVYAITRHLTGSTGAALLAAVGFAASAGTWSFGTDAEPVLQPLALTLAPVWGLLAAGPAPSRRQVVLLGLTTALAILTYLSSVILIPALAVGLLAERQSGTERWRRLGLFGGVVGGVVAPIYLLAMVTTFGVRDLQAAQRWHFYGGLNGSAPTWGQVQWANVPYGAYGFLRSLVWYPPLRPDESSAVYLASASWAERAAFAGYVGGGLLVAAAPLVALAVLLARRRVAVARRDGVMLAAWGALNAAFAGWWVPSDLQFWAPGLAAWWLLVGIVLAAKPAGEGWRWARRISPWPAAIGGVILLAPVNGLGFIAPGLDAENDRRYVVAAALRAVSAPDDLVVTNSLNAFNLYLAYFAPRPLVDVNAALISAPNRDAGQVLAGIARELDAARAAGRRVFVVRGRTAGDVGAADAAGQVAMGAVKQQRMYSAWYYDEALRRALGYLDGLPTRRVWGDDREAILEVVPTLGAAGP